ncbi:MAG: response regulator [Candidatus Abyssobacteria bacterium SURF_5]|uniref:Response regulator n=1 Tax=Abyssobacteria bacterium (strain SURF_5) TaxID=2093360 RepID=A0A3A4NPV8_ABYX5|nr:MAG: response regulator [Candidatus Abyssubacteria bacterium SURF_5]
MPVVTIFSASFCRGDEVAGTVAAKLGYSCINGQVLSWAAKEFGVPEEKLHRTLHGSTSLLEKFVHEKERHIAYIKAAIAHLVQSDNVVYHGFAGHLLPRTISHVLKVCLVANRDYRIPLAMEEAGIGKRDALKRIQKDDEERKKWTQHLFDLGPWDKSLYDIKIPMQTTSPGETAELICTNARSDAVRTTASSLKMMNDFAFASRVNVALVERGHDVDVVSDSGNVTILINKYTVRLESLKNELREIAGGIPGVRNIEVRVGPKYKRPAIYPAVEFELPSKVLLVDDEREFVQTLSERLQMRDLSTAVVYNGEEALSYLNEEEPEVMILDLRMPGIDGVDVLRRVKKEHPNVEVIILTGHGTEKDAILTRELGAFAYLEKPVEIEKLAQTVKAAYEKIRKEKVAKKLGND